MWRFCDRVLHMLNIQNKIIRDKIAEYEEAYQIKLLIISEEKRNCFFFFYMCQ